MPVRALEFAIGLLPQRCRPWFQRYRRRLAVLSILGLVYGAVTILDWVLNRFILDLPLFQSGPLRMTRRHFEAPSRSVFNWDNMNRFLDEVTRNKPGILGEKWVYVVLIGAYLALCVVVFMKLTPPDRNEGEATASRLPSEPPD